MLKKGENQVVKIKPKMNWSKKFMFKKFKNNKNKIKTEMKDNVRKVYMLFTKIICYEKCQKLC